VDEEQELLRIFSSLSHSATKSRSAGRPPSAALDRPGFNEQLRGVHTSVWTSEDMTNPRASSGNTKLSTDDPAWAGAALYSRRNLRFYDFGLAFNCRVFWRCPRSRLVELYDAHVSGRHLDIGVATGWLLDACRFPIAEPAITLMDLNPDTLAAASERLARYRPTTHQANALEPFGLPEKSFDSVGMSLLLHCQARCPPRRRSSSTRARSSPPAA
jgi:methyltransferase family protein